MSWPKPTRVEWLSFLTMMPFLCILLNYLLFENRTLREEEIWLYSFPILYIQGIFSWYLHIAVMHWLRQKFPDIKQTTLRLTLLGIIHIALSFVTFLAIIYVYKENGFLNFEFSPHKIKVSLFMAIALTMVATTMWEADYTFNQWKKSAAEKEKLEQLSIQQEFHTLKSQVNPHFLFNCFNTLSSLISEDKKQAEAFLDELSKVYRYLLRNNESSMSTLHAEVNFIESYYRLLKTRHGDAVQIKIDIDRKYEDYLLPSLSLQLLVENAVKHNVLSKNKPLLIDIFSTAGNKLVVNNNLQRRTVKVNSHGIGLKNIHLKYRLLDHQGFQVLEDSKNFSVVLPLIWNKIEERRITNQLNKHHI